MPSYVTRVSILFNSEGASPSMVIKKLLELGFMPVRGAYDFAYEHEQEDMSNADLMSAIIEISDALHKTLAGFNVMYTLDTREQDDVDLSHLKDIDEELESLQKELDELEKEEKE
ncbi:MAG: hypothetical protein EAX81_05745 [Candidatus Thorarchaeota archaeon]|nr:hypothetical protein [Candidatus Thorarchaeota archaeon]